MMTCREVSSRLLRDETADARISVWMHLAFCRHCRAFRRQLQLMWGAARRLALRFEAEPGPDFASRLWNQMAETRPSDTPRNDQ
jgi:hypothetical protein